MLEALDAIVGSEEIRAQIYPIIERVRTELARNEKAQMTWEPIPLAIYGGALPSGIRSSWVFVLREISHLDACVPTYCGLSALPIYVARVPAAPFAKATASQGAGTFLTFGSHRRTK